MVLKPSVTTAGAYFHPCLVRGRSWIGGYQKELRRKGRRNLWENRSEKIILNSSGPRQEGWKEKRSEKEYRQTKEVGSVGERLRAEGDVLGEMKLI